MVILPYRPEIGRECQNAPRGWKVLFGEPVVLAGQGEKCCLKIIRFFSIFPACFTTPCFTLFQVPCSDRHQLDGAPGSNKPASDGEGPTPQSPPAVTVPIQGQQRLGEADSPRTGSPRLKYSKPPD